MFSNPFAPSTILTDHSVSTTKSIPTTRTKPNIKSSSSSPSLDPLDNSRRSSFTRTALRTPLDASTHRASTPGVEPTFTEFIPALPDCTRRKSVDVGVLGLGYHRHGGGATTSKRMREAVGPDAGDKQIGLFGSGPKGGKDRL